MILPNNRLLHVKLSNIRTAKGLSKVMVSGSDIRGASLVTTFGPPVSSSCSTALWTTCEKHVRGGK